MLVSTINNNNNYNQQLYKPHKQQVTTKGYSRLAVAQSPSFKGLGTLTTNALKSLNPLNNILNSVFKRSVLASRKIFKSPIPSLQGKIEEIMIPTKNKKLIHAWNINPNKNKEYVLFLHGTSHNITNSQHFYESIINTKKFGVFIPEYRGYGKNQKINVDEHTLIEDGQAAVDYLVNKKNVNKNSISIVGHSLGGGIAAAVARRNPELKQVVLISPINTLKHELENIKNNKHIKMPKFLRKIVETFPWLLSSVNKKFNTNKELQNTIVPTHIIHSKNDKLILSKSSVDLAKHAKNLSSINLIDTGGHGLEVLKIDKTLECLLKG